MRYRTYRGHLTQTGAFVVGLGLALLAVVGTGATGESATLAAVLVVGSRQRSLAGLVGAIAVGALGLGAIAWLLATGMDVVPFGTSVTVGLGLAIGGGLGSVVWLLVVGEEAQDSTETVTVDMSDETPERPSPEPADLFDASPDPIVFFAASQEGPVVLAVNEAFEDAFGVTGSALAETPLADGVLLAEGGDDLATAARDGEPFDRVMPCETDDGHRDMRVRLALTGDPADTGGYVVYTPVDDA